MKVVVLPSGVYLCTPSSKDPNNVMALQMTQKVQLPTDAQGMSCEEYEASIAEPVTETMSLVVNGDNLYLILVDFFLKAAKRHPFQELTRVELKSDALKASAVSDPSLSSIVKCIMIMWRDSRQPVTHDTFEVTLHWKRA